MTAWNRTATDFSTSSSVTEVDRIAREPNTVVISCHADLNLDVLKKRCWQMIGLDRVYTKKRGAMPDLSDPLICKRDASVEAIVRLLCLVAEFLF